MTERQFDNGSGAKFFPSASRTALTSLASTPAIKTTGAITYGFSTSAKGNALVTLVNQMRLALIAAGIGV